MSGYGRQTPTDAATEFNAHAFLIRQFLSLVRTATLVQVVSCTNDDDVAPVGFVDVLPLVGMVDGVGTVSQHGVIHNLPYSRLQGGLNAVILDPEPGDIGVAVFGDSDLSAVKSSGAQAPPGSFRKFDSADGLYVGWTLNRAPVQYVQFQTGIGITVKDVNGNTIVMSAAGITITDTNGNVINMNKLGIDCTSPRLTDTSEIYSLWKGTPATSHSVGEHTHTQGVDSHGDTEAPTNAPTVGT